jgi:hypothetical protein
MMPYADGSGYRPRRFRCRSCSARGESQPPAQARAAGADRPPFGRAAERREVARRTGVGRPAVWRWQRRFALAVVDGLLRDATRKPGKPRLEDAFVRRVVALTCAEPRGEATHWTGRAMAKEAGISARSVQRISAARPASPSNPHLQALERPRVRRPARGHRRALPRSTGAQPGAVPRREVACVDGPRLAREKLD